MIDREHIEKILKLNGLAPSAEEDEIKSILLSARYKEHEVDAAIMVLRENPKTKKTNVAAMQKVFHTDKLLNEQEISSLLGIDVDLSSRVSAGKKARKLSFGGQVSITALSTLLALIALCAYMYIEKIGIFHHTSAFVF